jgi:chromate transporter
MVWFALNVMFGKVRVTDAGPLHLNIPDLASVRLDVVALAALASLMLFGLHRGIITTLAVCGGLALLWHAIH